MIRSPSKEIRCFSFSAILSRFFDSKLDRDTRQRNVTLVFTLLTFWPPGPEPRANVKLNSLSGILTFGLMTNIGCLVLQFLNTAAMFEGVDLPAHGRPGLFNSNFSLLAPY